MEEKTPLQKVVDIFIDYYGEDRIDLQGNYIYVYFPYVTVTNENDRSIDITELYAKVNVDDYGKLISTFALNRSEYKIEQWLSDYMHSHIPSIPKDNLISFLTPCLGGGPIRGTCSTLNIEFDEDIWRLFVLELDKYVHTESVSGRPYHYLERISLINNRTEEVDINQGLYSLTTSEIEDTVINKFLPYIIQRRLLSFAFNNKYIIADSPYNIVVKLSNLFIEWYNNLPASEQGTIKEDMFNDEMLIICKVNNERIFKNCIINRDYSMYRRVIGTNLWKFKGNTVRLNITGIPENNNPIAEMDENSSVLLHPDIVMNLVNRILRIVNYKYGNTEGSESSQETTYL